MATGIAYAANGPMSQKTTSWFVMSREGTIGAQTNVSGNVTIVLPENNITVRNAWVEVEFMEGDSGANRNITTNVYLNGTLLDGTGTTY